MKFLENPYELWDSEVLEDRRNVLKLCFTGKLCFDKNEGFRTACKSLPFTVLEGLSDPNSDMVPGAGIEPARTQCPRDFKSLVSTNFTIRAIDFMLY
tara:strand:+ start:1208 stop:1498 length:291 start_codon:yes stop_codon:yes gene_type:complete